MSWADRAVADLKNGVTTHATPHGNSMLPLITSGETVTLAPLGDHVVAKGDVVLVRLRGNVLLHKVSAVQGDRVQISKNHQTLRSGSPWLEPCGGRNGRPQATPHLFLIERKPVKLEV